MPKQLSAEAVRRFNEHGYLSPLSLLNAEQTKRYRQCLADFEAHEGGQIKGQKRNKSHLFLKWLDELVHHPAILDAVEDLHGPDLFCWSSSFFIKEPRNPAFVSWHQDSTYWGLNKPDVVTAWIALSPSIKANGAMEVIPGSHHLNQVPHRDTFAKDNMLTRGQEVAVEVDATKAVTIELQPGEMSLHHVLLVHGSAPNPSDLRRIGFAARYIPTSVKQLAGERDSATLVRGNDVHGHFEHEPRATRDLDPAFLALHADIALRNAKILYRGTNVKDFNQTAR